jgi:putative ABC transport system substrate-binding protein
MWSSAIGCLVTLTLSLLAAPLNITAQPRGKSPRLGVLDPNPQQHPTPCLPAFQQGLRDLVYVEGQNLLVDYRYADDQVDRLPALLAALVQRAPDVIWLHSDPAVWAAKRAATTIPIIFGIFSGQVEQGIVASLARPGGNLTGMELRNYDLEGKRLELFKEALPTLSRVAVLVNPAEPTHAGMPSNLEREARALGVQLLHVEAGAPADFEAAFAAMVRGGADGLLFLGSVFFTAHRQQLMALALQHRLPTMAHGRHIAKAGSLLAYGATPPDLCQRSAVFVHKILHGAKPADLPIEGASTFQLVVNLKTAEALGLTLSPLFLSRADAVLR